jgi:hypothetical protein
MTAWMPSAILVIEEEEKERRRREEDGDYTPGPFDLDISILQDIPTWEFIALIIALLSPIGWLLYLILTK